jgi:hypothetical protein
MAATDAQSAIALATNETNRLSLEFTPAAVAAMQREADVAVARHAQFCLDTSEKSAYILQQETDAANAASTKMTAEQYNVAKEARTIAAKKKLTLLEEELTANDKMVKDDMQSAMDSIIAATIETFKSAAGFIIDLCASLGTLIIQGVMDIISSAINMLQTELVAIANTIINNTIAVMASAFNLVMSTIKNAILALVAPINTFFDYVENLAGMIDKFINFFKRLKGQVNTARQTQLQTPDGKGGFTWKIKNIIGTAEIEAWKKFPLKFQEPEIISVKLWKPNPLAKFTNSAWMPKELPYIQLEYVMPMLLAEDAQKAKYGKTQVKEFKDGTTTIRCEERKIERHIHGPSGNTSTKSADGSEDYRLMGGRVCTMDGADQLTVGGNSVTHVSGNTSHITDFDSARTVYSNDNETVYQGKSLTVYGKYCQQTGYDYAINVGASTPPSPPTDPILAAIVAGSSASNIADSANPPLANFYLSTTGDMKFNCSQDWDEEIEGPLGKTSTIYGPGGLTYACPAGQITMTGALPVNISSEVMLNLSGGTIVRIDADGIITISGQGMVNIDSSGMIRLSAPLIMMGS